MPAKVIKYRFDDETIGKLLKLKWWEMDFSSLKGIQFDNIKLAIKQLEVLKSKI